MHLTSRQKGFISFKVLLFLLALFVVVHIGIKLVPMYIDAERMKDAMTVKAELAQNLKDEEILTDLAQEAKDLDLPLKRDDFVLIRDDDNRTMQIKTKWDVRLNFFWGTYIKDFHFEPVISADYARHF